MRKKPAAAVLLPAPARAPPRARHPPKSGALAKKQKRPDCGNLPPDPGRHRTKRNSRSLQIFPPDRAGAAPECRKCRGTACSLVRRERQAAPWESRL